MSESRWGAASNEAYAAEEFRVLCRICLHIFHVKSDGPQENKSIADTARKSRKSGRVESGALSSPEPGSRAATLNSASRGPLFSSRLPSTAKQLSSRLYTHSPLFIMSTNTASMTSQPVVFSTRTQYPLPSQKFMIPTSWKRYQLSQLINKALSLEKPVPFDFLVKGELLHTTLSQWCADNGVGEVRYTLSADVGG